MPIAAMYSRLIWTQLTRILRRRRAGTDALLILLMLSCIAGGGAQSARAIEGGPPPLPSTLYSRATLDGRDVPAGTIIAAGRGGMIHARAGTFTDQGVSV